MSSSSHIHYCCGYAREWRGRWYSLYRQNHEPKHRYTDYERFSSVYQLNLSRQIILFWDILTARRWFREVQCLTLFAIGLLQFESQINVCKAYFDQLLLFITPCTYLVFLKIVSPLLLAGMHLQQLEGNWKHIWRGPSTYRVYMYGHLVEIHFALRISFWPFPNS